MKERKAQGSGLMQQAFSRERVARPRLRFPEFEDAPEWEAEKLSALIDLVSGMHLSPDQYSTVGEVPYFTGPSDFTNDMGRVAKWTTSSTNMAREHDTLITVKGSGVGECWYLEMPSVAMGRQLMAVRAKASSSRFINQFLRSKRTRFEDLASGNLIPGLARDDILNLVAPFPKKDEQQRIADCLTSLDEVIAAQGRKVEALKAHKRGLMQQLFPREGEARPRLRFPEFRKAAEWKETPLGKLGKLIPGLTYNPEDVRDEGLLVLRSSNIQGGEISLEDNVYVSPEVKAVNLAEPNDILICVRNGSKSLIGKSALIPDDMPQCTHGAFMTVFRTHAHNFVSQLFQTSAYQKQVAGDLGATINSINGGQFVKYRFLVPTEEEQQRIANCLSSLNAQIAAESSQLSALKTHKEGLMQQLFPAPESTSA